MRTSVAFFAGVGTVVVAIGAGLGGGLLMADIMNPHPEMFSSKLDRRTAPEQKEATKSTATASNDQLQTVPYLAATQQAANAAVKVAPAPQPSPQPQPQNEANNAAPQPAAISDQPGKPADSSATKQAPHEQASAADDTDKDSSANDVNSNAKARDAELKRTASDRRRADRRQRSADRRQGQPYQPPQPYQQQASRDDEMRDVEQRVREETEQPQPREVIVRERAPREVVVRRYADRPDYADSPPPPRAGFPLFNLFGGQGD